MTDTAQPRTAVTQLNGRVSQCTGCGEVFGGVAAFDRHRARRAGRRVCLDPVDCGLVILSNAKGTRWGEPMTEEGQARIQDAAQARPTGGKPRVNRESRSQVNRRSNQARSSRQPGTALTMSRLGLGKSYEKNCSQRKDRHP